MASKTISVTKEVYDLLVKVKLPHESFGDTIKRLIEEKTTSNLIKWVKNNKLWSTMSDQEFNEIKKALNTDSLTFTPQEVKID